MKIIFSRKGFDSAAGGVPSPITDGRPLSMPIPASRNSVTTYADLGLAQIVEKITHGRIGGSFLCHHDPMFVNGESILGQTGAARTHLTRSGVGPGDLFLFFGLFAEEHSGERHHRLFGYLRVRTACVVSELGKEERSELAKLRHPHLIGDVRSEDVIYRGEGAVARTVLPELRLTRPGGPVSRWCVPAWLADRGLSYHGRPDRWSTAGELSVVSRGQEFVCDIAGDPVARAWAEEVVARMRA